MIIKMQENKLRIIIIILIILIFLVAIGGTALYLTTDLFKSSQVLFQKYIAQDIENIADVFEVSQEEKNIDLLRNSDFKSTSDATLKYLEEENDEEEVYKIKEEGINKAQEKASYVNISTTYGDNTILSLDLLAQKNVYGLRLANLVQQFVSVENATVSYFVSSLGLNGNAFSETMKSVDISGLFDFSDEEKESLTNTYLKLIVSDIDKNHYKSKSNSMITLNNKESVTTNEYSLTLTKNELDKIYKKILNQAVNDQIILGKLDNIDAKIKEAGFSEADGNSLKEKYTEKLQNIIDNIEYQGEDNRQIVITVYVQKGTTVRTTIKTESNEWILDLDETNGKTLSLKTKETIDQEEISTLYTIGKAENEQGRNRIFSYSDSSKNLNVSLNTVQNDAQIIIDTNVNYKDFNITNIDFASKTNIELSANEAIPVNFDDKNNILLNNFEGERVLSILDNLKNRLIASLEESQSVINSKLLNNIILKIDEKEQAQQQAQQDNIEAQKEKFNNKFILYQGEDIEKEYVQKLIKTAGENMTGYELINGKHIKLLIEEGIKNEEKANEISAAIEASIENYDINLNYNEDGYVESIDIIVHEKK